MAGAQGHWHGAVPETDYAAVRMDWASDEAATAAALHSQLHKFARLVEKDVLHAEDVIAAHERSVALQCLL